MTIGDEQVAELARGLEAAQHGSGCWTSPARLFGLGPSAVGALDTALAMGAVPWRLLGEGNAYHLLETTAVAEPEVVAVALLVHGWAFPPEDPVSWVGRPSQHPGRIRVRTVTVVTADGHQCSAIRLRHRDVVVDTRGHGPLLDALRTVWRAPPRPGPSPASARLARRPAHCRRDQP